MADILTLLDTPIVFKASGGSATFTPTSLAQNAARLSARFDFGDLTVTPKPLRFAWRAKTKCAVAGTLDLGVRIYLATSDGTIADGNVGTADAALASIDKVKNLYPIGTIIVDKSADATEPFQASGICELWSRYVSVVWHNVTGQALSATGTDHEFSLTPLRDQVI